MANLIKGKVISAHMVPLQNVEVFQINSPKNKVLTDINGNFEIITSGEIDFKKQNYYVLQKFDGKRVVMTTSLQIEDFQLTNNDKKSSNGLLYLGLAITGFIIYKSIK
jgi:hypothetical protein